MNTSKRIKNGKSVTPVFLFAVFLWSAQNKRFNELNKKMKSRILTMMQASEDVISKQTEQVLMPRWLSNRVKDVWLMQYQLENCSIKKAKELIRHPRFRLAYDFLVLRSESINPELSERAKYWTQATTIKRAVLITGCSSGIGLCLSHGLRSAGYHVFATAKKSRRCNKTEKTWF